MRLFVREPKRRGAVLPLVAMCLVALLGFIALALDLGRVALAKSQCQMAADLASMAGARTINGSASQNLAAATANAQAAAANCKIMGKSVAAPNAVVVVTHGTYRYDPTAQKFSPAFTLTSSEIYNLTQTTVSASCPTFFASASGASGFNVSASAIATHHPRDVAVVLDYSGSMNNESDLWNNESYLDNGQSAPNNANFTSNNAETVYPLFGHYANEKNYSDYTDYANLLSPTADPSNPLTNNAAIGKSNVSVAAMGVQAIAGDFWQNAWAKTAAPAFTPIADLALDSKNQAGGDLYLRINNQASNGYATTVADVLNGKTKKNSAFESKGYKNFTASTFNGYILGPRYWGKTFFVWPPDPTNDWRQKYFGTNDNTELWDGGGNWQDPPNNYTINYKAILTWIRSAPTVFPLVLRSGNVLFYDAIPLDVPASAYDHTQPNYNITDPNQRFWKEYIDYVVGVWRDPYGNVQHPQSPSCSYGPDYTFGTIQISLPPSDGRFMDYLDNPERPRHRLWFGPMTMIQYMSDTGLLPGTTHDISMYPMKIGIGGALLDIQSNHPNDLVSMILFNRPQYTNDPQGTGGFNVAQYSLTNNYAAMINSLWVPPNSGSADVRPWDSNGSQTPRAHGDYTANTASSYGVMLAYNQFSGSSTLRSLDQSGTAGVGGLGRVGATRLLIYETDGMANQESVPRNGFYNGGAANSYYRIQPGQPVDGAGYSQPGLLQAFQNICNNPDGTPGTPAGYSPYSQNQGYGGYALPGKSVQVQCIAFGSIFEVPSSIQDSSVNLLSQISSIGGSTFPSSASDSANGWRWCIGSNAQRQAALRTAFMKIMNGGVTVTLVK